MKTQLFDYYLPKELIAQKPIKPRDHSRLLVFFKTTTSGGGFKTRHDHFYNLDKYLKPGDLLVLNNSKVFPARLWTQKPTGGKLEILLLKKTGLYTWECLIGGKNPRVGMKLRILGKDKLATKHRMIITGLNEGDQALGRLHSRGTNIYRIKFNVRDQAQQNILENYGQAPTPPYIKRLANLKEYQTVYADDSKLGSAAAPTAGFHFTPRLFQKLKKAGIETAFVTLHVGLGTFEPVKTDKVQDFKIHQELFEVTKATMARLKAAKVQGRRVIPVGTTSARVLESLPQITPESDQAPSASVGTRFGRLPIKKWTNLFIYPGYKFKNIDGLITNFHLPKSSLIMLVSAFAGRKRIMKAYKIAKKQGYRFYSFGDGMLII